MDKAPAKIRKMFDEISHKYDFMNDMMSFFTHRYVKKQALNDISINEDMRVLDCCTGTGDIPKILKKKFPKLEITGIDFSSGMLKIARAKVSDVNFIQADCTKMPFTDNSFDFATIFFGLRNIECYETAIIEIRRVLRQGGKLSHLDFNKSGFLNKFFDKFVKNLANLFFTDVYPYEYLINSKNNFFSQNELTKHFEKSGFRLKFIKNYLSGIIQMQVFEKV